MSEIQRKRMMSDEIRDFMLDLTRDVLVGTIGEERVIELDETVDEFEKYFTALDKTNGECLYIGSKISRIINKNI